MQEIRKSFIVFEKPDILFKNLKTLTSSNYPRIHYFPLKLRMFPAQYSLQKDYQDFFYYD